jgi:hypothetical protein
MSLSSDGDWVVSLIGRHTVQITGPTVSPTGAWYTGKREGGEREREREKERARRQRHTRDRKKKKGR